MSGILNSSLSGSNSNLPESTSRSFATSFAGQSAAPSPVYNHSGTMQGMQNMNGNFNVQNMQGTLTTRSAASNGAPSSGLQQPIGSLSGGRYPSNNIPVGLSQPGLQMSHGGSHGHSRITNRGGINIVGSPVFSGSMIGVRGARMTGSMGNIGVGVNNVRNISSGGMSVSGLASRLNMAANTGSGNLASQGPNRFMGGMLQQGNPTLMLSRVTSPTNMYFFASSVPAQNSMFLISNYRRMYKIYSHYRTSGKVIHQQRGHNTTKHVLIYTYFESIDCKLKGSISFRCTKYLLQYQTSQIKSSCYTYKYLNLSLVLLGFAQTSPLTLPISNCPGFSFKLPWFQSQTALVPILNCPALAKACDQNYFVKKDTYMIHCNSVYLVASFLSFQTTP
ncbi:hypothetical protein MKW94_015869 [Papaver nudicaule]|uniref:Uncharacterized protein n=1 Tax=Papaver nudicaule TaxID=74823 RepID=A0AA42ARY6_PAPNU|nr:hypothetical protein [Papaver nudicaule]